MPYVTLKNGNRIEARDEFTGESKGLEFDVANKTLLADFGDGSVPKEIGISEQQAADIETLKIDVAAAQATADRAESKADAAGAVANNKLDNSVGSHTEGMVPVADENGQLVDNYITNANIASSAAIESSKLAFTSAQSAALSSGIDTTKVAQIQTNADNISLVDTKATRADTEATRIGGLIPQDATTSNQLADKAFVNSTVGTNTANFIGTFNSLAELEAYSGTVTNNDYAFVIDTDSAGNTVYKRYKYTDATTPASWVFEYDLNNSSFTSAQWSAINSGVTSTTVSQVGANTSAIAGLATVATSGSYADLSNKPVVDQVYDSSSANAQSGVAVASAVSSLASSVESAYTAQDNTIINAINARKFVYCSSQIVDTATSGTYAWATNTDSDTSGTYGYVYTGTFGVSGGGIAYDANDKFAMVINFPPAKAVSGDYAPFCTFTTRNNGGQTWFDYKIYAKAIPSNGFTVDVVVMGQYPAISTINNSQLLTQGQYNAAPISLINFGG